LNYAQALLLSQIVVVGSTAYSVGTV